MASVSNRYANGRSAPEPGRAARSRPSLPRQEPHQLLGTSPASRKTRQTGFRSGGAESLEQPHALGGDECDHRLAVARDDDGISGFRLPETLGEMGFGTGG